MKHEQLQDEFYRDFEGEPTHVENWFIHQDYLIDQVEVLRSTEQAARSNYAQSIRAQVRAARIAKENQRIAKRLGVTCDDTH